MHIQIFFLLFVIQTRLSQADEVNEAVPQWQNLECQVNSWSKNFHLQYDIDCKEGHKYLFSEITHNWVDAAAECELYGGWLVNIESLAEQNCLVRYGNTHGLNSWYWTDGNSYLSIYDI